MRSFFHVYGAGVVMLLVGGIAYLIGGLAMLGRLLQPREGAPA